MPSVQWMRSGKKGKEEEEEYKEEKKHSNKLANMFVFIKLNYTELSDQLTSGMKQNTPAEKRTILSASGSKAVTICEQ